MSGEDYTIVYKLMQIGPRLEDWLKFFAWLHDELQQFAIVKNVVVIQKHKGLRPRNFQIGDTVSMKASATRLKIQKLMPLCIAPKIFTWVGAREPAKDGDPKGWKEEKHHEFPEA